MNTLPLSTATKGQGFPVRRLVWMFVALWGLHGCQTSPPREPVPPPAVPPGVHGAPAADARVHRVVAEDSLLQILVYRGGPMARLGHNHVIASHHLEGTVGVTEDATRMSFDLQFPVSELTVDEPHLRELAGPEFPATVPQSARDGTRKNLLSESLLDGANHPVIRLRSTDVRRAAEGYDVGVEVTLKGELRQVRVPVQLDRADGVLTARGEFPLRQSDLGLKPFSVAMGTLVVLDEMTVRFEIRATE